MAVARSTSTTRTIMGQVLLALLPGVAAMAWYFGPGVLVNLLLAIAAAAATEALVLSARDRPLEILSDRSALVTGMLLGLCLPPLLPAWMVILGSAFAVLFGKQLYGGLGNNPFNPAMVGYAMLIVAFPLAMSLWPTPGDAMHLAARDLIGYKLGMPVADGISSATPLDAFKFRGSATVEEFFSTTAGMAGVAGEGWQVVNIAFLAGGAWLAYRKACDWVMPVTFIGTLGLLAAIFYDGGSSSSLGSPLFHWFSGATMLAAFFIITDPVTSPDSRTGQIIFAAGIGLLTFIIRSIGAYPDGVAFAVLLMNAAAPLIDQWRWRFA